MKISTTKYENDTFTISYNDDSIRDIFSAEYYGIIKDSSVIVKNCSVFVKFSYNHLISNLRHRSITIGFYDEYGDWYPVDNFDFYHPDYISLVFDNKNEATKFKLLNF